MAQQQPQEGLPEGLQGRRNAVLVTGASGFVGLEVVRQLLLQEESPWTEVWWWFGGGGGGELREVAVVVRDLHRHCRMRRASYKEEAYVAHGLHARGSRAVPSAARRMQMCAKGWLGRWGEGGGRGATMRMPPTYGDLAHRSSGLIRPLILRPSLARMHMRLLYVCHHMHMPAASVNAVQCTYSCLSPPSAPRSTPDIQPHMAPRTGQVAHCS